MLLVLYSCLKEIRPLGLKVLSFSSQVVMSLRSLIIIHYPVSETYNVYLSQVPK